MHPLLVSSPFPASSPPLPSLRCATLLSVVSYPEGAQARQLRPATTPSSPPNSLSLPPLSLPSSASDNCTSPGPDQVGPPTAAKMVQWLTNQFRARD
eukprot:100102-Rhodomonas_salina.3